MEKKISIAGIQLAPGKDRAENLKKAVELITLASEKGAEVTALPQLFNTLWFPATINEENFKFAEEEEGETITTLRELALKLGIIIIAPIFEKAEGLFYNTAFVLGSDGSVLGKYRKIHVPQIPLWEERAYFKDGDLGFQVFDTPFAKIGVLLCWDVFFPEAFRELALNGAEIVFVPTASAFLHSHEKWERAIQASAHANGLYVFRVNRVGAEEKQEFYGRSFCAGPDGELVIKPAGSSEGIILAQCDPAVTSTLKKDWVFMKDRRPSEYKKITQDLK